MLAVGKPILWRWKYIESKIIPKHTLLIEATLADGTNQRRMEMEPVSKTSTGEYCLANQMMRLTVYLLQPVLTIM